MEPEEMDLVELVEKVAVEPAWQIRPDEAPRELNVGDRGMVVHRHEGTPALYDVEFLHPETHEVYLLATLPITQLRVVGRDTLGLE